MDSISLSVVHPAFERLKRSGSWLHVAAGLLILTHAISHFHRSEPPGLYFWCLLIISLDIFLLVGVGREVLRQLPRVKLPTITRENYSVACPESEAADRADWPSAGCRIKRSQHPLGAHWLNEGRQGESLITSLVVSSYSPN